MLKVKLSRLLLLLPGALLLLLSVLLAPSGAEAAVRGCRGDPILYLSDGTVLTVTVDIDSDASAVKSIQYTLSVPKNVTLLRTVFTPFPGFTGKEKVELHDDARAGQYGTNTIVQTDAKNTGVVATTTMGSVATAVSGYSGQQLRALLSN